jgi:hypothetical protein
MRPTRLRWDKSARDEYGLGQLVTVATDRAACRPRDNCRWGNILLAGGGPDGAEDNLRHVCPSDKFQDGRPNRIADSPEEEAVIGLPLFFFADENLVYRLSSLSAEPGPTKLQRNIHRKQRMMHNYDYALEL